MASTTFVENWSVVYNYRQDNICLAGSVYGHPDFRDGSEVECTSAIITVEGNIVYCESRHYQLGAPNLAFVRTCEAAGIAVDSDNPTTAIPAMIEWRKRHH